jgi:hypothetical protein
MLMAFWYLSAIDHRRMDSREFLRPEAAPNFGIESD